MSSCKNWQKAVFSDLDIPAERTPGRIFLRQGLTVYLTAHEKVEIFTPLGPCVSCILFHEDVGAVVTHAKYPHQEGLKDNPGDAIVERSIHSAIEYFMQSPIHPKDWKVMLFGGGIIHYARGQLSQYGMLGWQNALRALQVLQENNLQISSADFGGFGGRRLYFWNETGQTKCERLVNSYGGIVVNSKTPAWLLRDSMETRTQRLQKLTSYEMPVDEVETFSA